MDNSVTEGREVELYAATVSLEFVAMQPSSSGVCVWIVF